ncbi:MAG TPA: hypothetical protein PL182_03930 [Pseudobdellovibrionaceae bacterium]|nr:hypothetical protein [Pseudobdellovibrionaceae bacterium]
MRVWVLALVVSFFGLSSALAQTSYQNESLRNWKRGTAIVMFSGLAGGVLGLSTLSFYGDPEEHTSNVTTGALIGMLGGAGFLLWESSQANARWSMTSQRGEPALAFRYEF